MTVEELIKKLKMMPQNKEVILYDNGFEEEVEIKNIVNESGCTVYIDFN